MVFLEYLDWFTIGFILFLVLIRESSNRIVKDTESPGFKDSEEKLRKLGE